MSPAGLEGLARFGPYFAIDTDRTGQPLRMLAGAVLMAQVAGVRERLGSELRVAASIFHLGLCARLVSPVIGAAVLGYRLDLTDATWSGPYPSAAHLHGRGRRGLAPPKLLPDVSRKSPVGIMANLRLRV